MAAGPRIQLFRTDTCGNSIEFGYLGIDGVFRPKILTGTNSWPSKAADQLVQRRFFKMLTCNLTSHIQTIRNQ